MNHSFSHAGHSAAGAPGFTLIEVLISMTVALFLLGGLLTIVQSTKRTFTTQSQMAQLQDNERLAMTFISEIIESAGYYPDPQNYPNPGVTFFPVAAPQGFTAALQVVYGVTAAGNDSVTVRYGAKPGDNIFGCTGKTNTTAANDTFVSKFSLDTITIPPGRLMCTFSTNGVAGVPVPLVNGVTSFTVLYGVTRNPGPSTGSCTDTYKTAAQMVVPTDWLAVCSVLVTMQLQNPLSTAANPLGPITITRLAAIMNTAGVN